ncbi:FecR family protein [Chitinophaga pinensis]|uniref:FecR protein domain-containing protein n=1 Tax=Chitinophaga pinensis TaxID=79329 RepID=A0A5C6LME6_9BACT|nr:FecR domain-containing protein [Chitinophaga pinensis]TWV93680.1 hypothetical protein FEF09_26640 [Chitinophaga pinensis]
MNNKDVTEFVIDCLTDAGNRDKQAALNQWLQESEDNRTLYAELKQLWEAAAGVPPVSFDKEESWKELPLTTAGSKPIKRLFPWKAVAAAVLLLLSGAGIWWWQSTALHWTTYTAHISDRDSLTLPDGSRVYLKPGTSLKYKQPFSDRSVILLSGEAYFDVTKAAEHTFLVQAGDAIVRVLGTAFNVRIEQNRTEVIVFEGKISLQKNGQQVVLSSGNGNKGTVDGDKGGILHAQGDYSNQCVWATADLSFENEEAAHVAAVIADYYKIPALKIPENLKHKRITLHLHNTPAEQAMEILATVLDE